MGQKFPRRKTRSKVLTANKTKKRRPNKSDAKIYANFTLFPRWRKNIIEGLPLRPNWRNSITSTWTFFHLDIFPADWNFLELELENRELFHDGVPIECLFDSRSNSFLQYHQDVRGISAPGNNLILVFDGMIIPVMG